MINNIISVIFLLLINICAGIGEISPLILIYIVVTIINSSGMTDFQLDFLFNLALILMIGRLFVLPFAYGKLEKSQKFKLIAKFICNLKKSFILKIITLVIVHCIYFISQIKFFHLSFVDSINSSLIYGITGSYVVLFLYWWIEDLIKNRKKPNANA